MNPAADRKEYGDKEPRWTTTLSRVLWRAAWILAILALALYSRWDDVSLLRAVGFPLIGVCVLIRFNRDAWRIPPFYSRLARVGEALGILAVVLDALLYWKVLSW